MADSERGHLVIPSELTEVATVQNAIVPLVEAAGYAREAVFAIRLALDEGVSNAIRHGNQLDASKTVSIDYEVTNKKVTVTICDQGPGFAPCDLPDPTLEENLCEPHGRGVMLMRAYMTGVSFNKQGNCVTLVKELGCRKPYDD